MEYISIVNRVLSQDEEGKEKHLQLNTFVSVWLNCDRVTLALLSHSRLFHITLHHNTTHHITSFHITSHHITSCHIMSHHVTTHDITSHHFTSLHITSHHTTHLSQCVTCLSEKIGLIEWVRNSEPVLRKLNTLRSLHGLPSCSKTAMELKPDYDRLQSYLNSGQKDLGLQMFFDSIMTACEPLLHEWLLLDYPSSGDWLRARELFTQTTAVWCMTGYISLWSNSWGPFTARDRSGRPSQRQHSDPAKRRRVPH